MKVLAIIPARGGSKGIPGKNLRPVGGRPLVEHVIKAAREARRVGRVVVSTDAPDIGAVAMAAGAEVVWRPADISGDLASSEAALLHVLDTLRETESFVPDVVVFLQCTSPLTQPEDIDATIEAMEREAADCALTVAPFHHFLWRTDPKEGAVGINHDKTRRPMRQQREGQFMETGAVYVMRAAGLLAHRHRFFGRVALAVTPLERSMEIDEPADLAVADMRLRMRDRAAQCAGLLASARALVMDFDGILTDNFVYVDQVGGEAVRCSRSDGWGIGKLRQAGLAVTVISTETNPVVQARCRKLGISCATGASNKVEALLNWCGTQGVTPQDVVFLGHDENDLDCLRIVGCAAVPADAHPAARALAHIVLSQAGGRGAVRELCDRILEQAKVVGGTLPAER